MTSLLSGLLASLQGKELKTRLLRDSVASAALQALSQGLALILGIVLARCLGAEGYGIYAYAFAIMSLLMVAAEAGVPTLLMREVAASHERKEWSTLRAVLIKAGQLVIAAASLVALAGIGVLWWLSESLSPKVFYTTLFMLLALPITALAKTAAHATRGLQQVVVSQVIELLARPLLAIALICIFFFIFSTPTDPQYAMAAQLGAAILTLGISLAALYWLTPKEIYSSSGQPQSINWLRSSLPFVLIGGAGIINSQTDIIMVGSFMNPDDVGIYRVAVQASLLVSFGLQVANNVFAPRFAKLYTQGNVNELKRILTYSSRIVLAATVPPVILLVLWGGSIASWLFGSTFEQSHLPLAILAIGELIGASRGPLGYLLYMIGQEKRMMQILLLSAALNIALNFILIPLLGLLGAALATASCQAIRLLLIHKTVSKGLKRNSPKVQP